MNTFNIKLYEERHKQYRYNLDEFGDPKQSWAHAYALCERDHTVSSDHLVLTRVFDDLDDAIGGAGLLLDEPDWWNRSLCVDYDGEWRYEDFWDNEYDDTRYIIVHYLDDTSPPVRMLLFVKKEI
jgi:hypothetical protein